MGAGFALPVGVNLVGILWRRELTGQVAANQRDLDLERLHFRTRTADNNPQSVDGAFLGSKCTRRTDRRLIGLNGTEVSYRYLLIWMEYE
jgi:hypothetical protein